MPSYDYRCEDCQRRVMLTFKTYAEYDTAPKVCPRCNGTRLTRLISKIALARSESSRFGADDVDDSMLDDLADSDPKTLGRYMRRMSAEMGEDMGHEFNEVVERLEHGEDPESIESSMALPPDDGGGDMISSGLDE